MRSPKIALFGFSMAELGVPKTQKSESKHVESPADISRSRDWPDLVQSRQAAAVDCRQGSWPILDLTPMITRKPERLPLTRRCTKFFYRPACLASIGMNACAVKEISIVRVLLPLMLAEKTLHDANNYLAHHF